MWYWFGIAALALIGEVLSGTFYLLLLAAACVAAGAAAAASLTLSLQLIVCAVILVAGTLILRRTGVLKTRTDSSSNADVNLDIGQTLDVASWEPGGQAQVWYRGAHWQAQASPGTVRQPGRHRIVAVRGSLLILEPDSQA